MQSDRSDSAEIALSVTLAGEEVFRVASDGRGVMPGESERDTVLRALANGLAMLLGTNLASDPLDATISVRRATPATIVRLER